MAQQALDSPEGNAVLAADIQQFVTVNDVTERYRGIPFPGTFMLDPQGRVTSRFFEDFYRERSTVTNLMLRLGTADAPVQATEVDGAQLTLRTYPSDPVVALGNRFTLVLDITPKPDMHVYAPGAAGYRVIALTIDPQPFVRTLSVQFPASEIYYFEPLDERVPVYQKPFTLLQEVVPEVTAEAIAAFRGQDKLTLSGRLDYQACDHTICYNPTSIPLSWTVGLQPFVPGAPREGGGGSSGGAGQR